MGRKNSKREKIKKRVNRSDKHSHDQSLTGVLDISRSGTGFVVVQNMPVGYSYSPG